ncbi:YciI family protein [Actinomadura hibisca]|uniref:YciI family protein n=1 Tax=Actinomadura hibisca TaxID=68565 RepID=UPI0012FCE052|nr:YciI family protein [Actinomadura hibisca]
MLLIYGTETGEPKSPDHIASPPVAAFIDDCRQRGVLVGAGRLRSVETATTVRVRDDELLLTDGPFAETREQLGGFFLLDCADLDEALAVAARCPMAATGSVEVRPLLGTTI